jgi:predicted dehydrogenase
MSQLKCAVIGVGYLGRFHAQKYKMLPDVSLIGISDIHKQTCDAVSQEMQVSGFYDYRDLFGKVDAVSIAASTKHHYDIARDCLAQGIHVLIEKPITETVEEADELIKLAHQKGVKLQVGHMERFNAAKIALDTHMDTPLYIDSQRLAPYTPRGADVNVVLDLMIHDIDIIQSLVKSPIIHMDAHGTPVLSSSIDIANARITFENQCIANITASRISFKTERKTRIFQENSYLSIDFHKKEMAAFTKGSGEMFPGIPDICTKKFCFEQGDALLEEIKSFVSCIKNDTTPLVSGKDGRDALSTAAAITSLIQINLLNRNVITT